MEKEISRRAFLKKAAMGASVLGAPFLWNVFKNLEDEVSAEVEIAPGAPNEIFEYEIPPRIYSADSVDYCSDSKVSRGIRNIKPKSLKGKSVPSVYSREEVKKYISANLLEKISDCEFCTWGMATTNGRKGGTYIPNRASLFNITQTARVFEDFVFDKLDKYGVDLNRVAITSFYRSMEKDVKLSPNNPYRTHPYGQAIDFAVGGVPSEDLYGMLSSWKGRLGRYEYLNSVHMDSSNFPKRRWVKKTKPRKV